MAKQESELKKLFPKTFNLIEITFDKGYQEAYVMLMFMLPKTYPGYNEDVYKFVTGHEIRGFHDDDYGGGHEYNIDYLQTEEGKSEYLGFMAELGFQNLARSIISVEDKFGELEYPHDSEIGGDATELYHRKESSLYKALGKLKAMATKLLDEKFSKDMPQTNEWFLLKARRANTKPLTKLDPYGVSYNPQNTNLDVLDIQKTKDSFKALIRASHGYLDRVQTEAQATYNSLYELCQEFEAGKVQYDQVQGQETLDLVPITVNGKRYATFNDLKTEVKLKLAKVLKLYKDESVAFLKKIEPIIDSVSSSTKVELYNKKEILDYLKSLFVYEYSNYLENSYTKQTNPSVRRDLERYYFGLHLFGLEPEHKYDHTKKDWVSPKALPTICNQHFYLKNPQYHVPEHRSLTSEEIFAFYRNLGGLLVQTIVYAGEMLSVLFGVSSNNKEANSIPYKLMQGLTDKFNEAVMQHYYYSNRPEDKKIGRQIEFESITEEVINKLLQ